MIEKIFNKNIAYKYLKDCDTMGRYTNSFTIGDIYTENGRPVITCEYSFLSNLEMERYYPWEIRAFLNVKKGIDILMCVKCYTNER